jgi:cephalosporin hydroxylase
LVSELGDLLLEDRLRIDISPPTLGAQEEPDARDESMHAPDATWNSETTEKELVDRFHHVYYYGSRGEHQVWVRTFWMNVPCVQCPLDLWVYQEIITELRPDLVVETGTLLGGTSLFLAQTLDAVGKGTVISIDVEDLPRPAHPRIEYIAGSSTDADLVRRVFASRPGRETRLVILDSAHTRDHVLDEMKLFAPFVTLGSYLIVTDSNINGHPIFPDFGPGPYEAVESFLSECDEFQIDLVRQKHKLTFNPNGYLKRVKAPAELS